MSTTDALAADLLPVLAELARLGTDAEAVTDPSLDASTRMALTAWLGPLDFTDTVIDPKG